MIKIWKNLGSLLMKTAIISGMTITSIFTGCTKPDDNIPPVNPPEKSIAQFVNAKNDSDNYVGIEYSATLSNVDKAQLNVKNDGVLISTEEISDASYKKTYEKAKKGTYEFILTSENPSDNLEKTNNITVVDFSSSINTVDLDLYTYSKKTVSLKTEDENYEDNPVSVVYVNSTDTKTQTQLNSTANANAYNLDIISSNQTGAYQLEVELKNAQGGLEKKILNGNILEDTRIDYTHRPNPGLNHYGSGDSNNDGAVNAQDSTRLIDVANGTFTDDNDPKLRARCDLNGDGDVNLQDVQIIKDKLNGKIPYLPGDWDNLPTRAEKEDWAKKMLARDSINLTFLPGGDCNQFMDQSYINFYGVSATDIPKFQEIYPNYNFTDNGLYNLPLLEVKTEEKDSEGKRIYVHAMNAFIFGNPSISFGNICPVESKRGHVNVQFGEDYLIGTNSTFYIRGPPIGKVIDSGDGEKDVEMQWYVRYSIKDKIATLLYVNPNLKIQE